jgi:hypothetical protein
MNIIDQLKTNKEAFGLMEPELKLVAEKIGWGNFMSYDDNGGFKVYQPPSDVPLRTNVIRLRDGFACQHTEHKQGMTDHEFCGHPATVCSWCNAEIKPEPKAGWVGYPIESADDKYLFRPKHGEIVFMASAPGMVGFGGIKYKTPCDCMGDDEQFYIHMPEPCEQHGPLKPLAVRFWRET